MNRDRPERALAGPTLTFDLAAEVVKLRTESAQRGLEHDAITLVKHPDLRIVLVAMNAGARLHRHETTARISVQCLEGRIRLRLDERVVELGASQLLVLDRSIAHDVEGIDASAFLLTMTTAPAP